MATAFMNVDTFLEGCASFVGVSKYALGGYGQVLTMAFLRSNKKKYSWYNYKSCIDSSKTNYEYLCQFTDGKWYATDCVCLLKGVLWGYRGDGTKGDYGSNGVKDSTDSDFFNMCYDKIDISGGKNHDKLKPGMILHMDGHVGAVYSVENGKITVVESCPTKDGTAFTSIDYQPWTGAGYSPYLIYPAVPTPAPAPTPSPAPQPITAGSTVIILEGAVYGGSAYGVKVPSEYIGKPYTVVKVEKHNNEEEALIKELNSWVATKYLQLVPQDKIVAGSTVVIISGAVYGGSAYGVKVPSEYIGKPYTVVKVEVHNNEDEALLKELNSWVAIKYLKLYTSTASAPAQQNYPVKTVWVGDLNVRKGPGTFYTVDRMVHKGTKFTVYETKGEWSRVGKDQWVFSKYIR